MMNQQTLLVGYQPAAGVEAMESAEGLVAVVAGTFPRPVEVLEIVVEPEIAAMGPELEFENLGDVEGLAVLIVGEEEYTVAETEALDLPEIEVESEAGAVDPELEFRGRADVVAGKEIETLVESELPEIETEVAAAIVVALGFVLLEVVLR